MKLIYKGVYILRFFYYYFVVELKIIMFLEDQGTIKIVRKQHKSLCFLLPTACSSAPFKDVKPAFHFYPEDLGQDSITRPVHIDTS